MTDVCTAVIDKDINTKTCVIGTHPHVFHEITRELDFYVMIVVHTIAFYLYIPDLFLFLSRK